jgi:transposase
MGFTLNLVPDVPISENQLSLKDLQVARTALVKERTRLRNRSHVQVNPVLKRQIKARLALVERQLAELDTEIARLIASDEAVPGHGFETARCADHAAILTPVAASGSRVFCSALI